MKKEAILAKIKAEPDPMQRFVMLVKYLMEHGTEEDRNRAEAAADAMLKAF